jgi:hypothetical protein
MFGFLTFLGFGSSARPAAAKRAGGRVDYGGGSYAVFLAYPVLHSLDSHGRGVEQRLDRARLLHRGSCLRWKGPHLPVSAGECRRAREGAGTDRRGRIGGGLERDLEAIPALFYRL